MAKVIIRIPNYVNAGGGGTGLNIYYGPSPSTVNVQNIPAGSNIYGQTYDYLLGNIYAPFVQPTINSFIIQSQPVIVEVGTLLSGNKIFQLTYSNINNITTNSLSIRDVTNNIIIINNQPIVTNTTVDIGSISKLSAAFHQWRSTVIDTQNNVISSPIFTVNWQWRMFNGTSTNTTLDENAVESLISSSLRSNRIGTFSFQPGGYKYICYPDSFGSPTIITGFRDTATNLSVVMADDTDNIFYNNIENGWNYGLINVENIQGVSTLYRIYRTKNILGSSINIQIT